MKITAQKVVWISIVGDPHPKGFPFIPNDHGLVSKFREWCDANGIWTVLHAGHSGGGGFAGAFNPKYLPQIKAFFKNEGFEVKTL